MVCVYERLNNNIHTIPATPLPRRNSTTPIDPFVISYEIVPKETAGAKQAK